MTANTQNQVNIKLSDAQMEKVKLSAEILGLPVSKYIRQRILNLPIEKPKFPAKERLKIIRQISGISTNINQLAKLNNQLGFNNNDTGEQIEKMRIEVKKLWQQLEK